jgi:hypothetical protein
LAGFEITSPLKAGRRHWKSRRVARVAKQHTFWSILVAGVPLGYRVRAPRRHRASECNTEEGISE